MAWRSNIDALTFHPDGRQVQCTVHRRAFRTLLSFDPTPDDCEAFFRTNKAAFEAAARAKILQKSIADGLNFHLTSRDIAQQMRSPSNTGSAKI
jgi:hypothetical protein